MSVRIAVAVDGRETLDPKDAGGFRRARHLGRENLRRRHLADRQSDALEIIVVMRGFAVMMRAPAREIVFGGGAETEENGGVDSPLSAALARPRLDLLNQPARFSACFQGLAPTQTGHRDSIRQSPLEACP